MAEETLGLRRAGFSPALSLLMPTYALHCRPPALVDPASASNERSPTAVADATAHSFGDRFEPRCIFGAGALDQ